MLQIQILQLFAHLWGDYIFQTDWMATRKRDSKWVAAVHAFVYSLAFIPLCHGIFPLEQWFVILATHAVIDHYGVARYVIFAKNWLTGWEWRFDASRANYTEDIRSRLCNKFKWSECSKTGYLDSQPPWLTVWLMIIVDNTLHLTVNWYALSQL